MKYVALVDDYDYERVSKYNWSVDIHGNTKYANAKVNGVKTKLHRFIMNAKDGEMLDHMDMDGLNCQRYNLRFCTRTQNASNRGVWGSGRFVGVCVKKKGNRTSYTSYIRINWKLKWLGSYKTELMAAMIYDEAARIYFGEFARLNLPDCKIFLR